MITPSLVAFKTAIKAGVSGVGTPTLHKLMTSTVLSTEMDRRIKFTISDESVDRDNDVVRQTGWDTKSYLRNPVVLWGHKAGELPIGKCVSIGLEDSALKALVEFVPADMPVVGPLAEATLRMCRDGFLSATSVGFRVLDFELAKERDDEMSWFPPVNFLRQELLEFSIVSIPANPEALIEPDERRAANSQLAAAAEAAKQLAAAEARKNTRLAKLRAYG